MLHVCCSRDEGRWGRDDGASRLLEGKGTVFCAKMVKIPGFYWPLPHPGPTVQVSFFGEKYTCGIWNSARPFLLSVLSFGMV